jgi:hypothetical protein
VGKILQFYTGVPELSEMDPQVTLQAQPYFHVCASVILRTAGRVAVVTTEFRAQGLTA